MIEGDEPGIKAMVLNSSAPAPLGPRSAVTSNHVSPASGVCRTEFLVSTQADCQSLGSSAMSTGSAKVYVARRVNPPKSVDVRRNKPAELPTYKTLALPSDP